MIKAGRALLSRGSELGGGKSLINRELQFTQTEAMAEVRSLSSSWSTEPGPYGGDWLSGSRKPPESMLLSTDHCHGQTQTFVNSATAWAGEAVPQNYSFNPWAQEPHLSSTIEPSIHPSINQANTYLPTYPTIHPSTHFFSFIHLLPHSFLHWFVKTYIRFPL